MTLAETLRQAIQESPASLNQIAKQAGLNYWTVWKFTHGNQSLRLENTDKLMRALGLVVKKRLELSPRKVQPIANGGDK